MGALELRPARGTSEATGRHSRRRQAATRRTQRRSGSAGVSLISTNGPRIDLLNSDLPAVGPGCSGRRARAGAGATAAGADGLFAGGGGSDGALLLPDHSARPPQANLSAVAA